MDQQREAPPGTIAVVQEPPPPPTYDTLGFTAWLVLFVLVLAYEWWASRTGRQTLSQTVQRGPRWFRWSLGISFAVLLVRLFV